MPKYVGKDIPLHDALGKVTGRLKYCADLQTVDMLHLKIFHSTVAHGRVVDIDVSAAAALPGVIKVLTPANTPAVYYDRGRVRTEELGCDQETLFTDHPRFVGDRIAGVVAVSPEIARAACELIKVTYEELPAAFDIKSALACDLKLHEQNNVVETPPIISGDFAACPAEHETQTLARIQRVTHVAMEPHAAVAEYRPESGKLTIWTPCQSVFGIRNTLAHIFGMPLNKIRVIKTAMGGSFGSKQETILEPLAAAAAIAVEGTVKLVFSREEVISNTMLKHPMEAKLHSKFSGEGRLLGLDFEGVLDAGAYQTVSPSYQKNMGHKLGKVYDYQHLHYHGRSICTNTPVSGSYRSWSSSEAVYAMESHMNTVAVKLGLDPVELRLKNIVQPGGINRFDRQELGNVRLEDCLSIGSKAFGWKERKQAAEEKQQGRYRRGVGMALGSHTSGFFPKQSDMVAALLKMQDDGSVIIDVCVHDHGCGTVTALCKIVAEELSLPLDLVVAYEGDTDVDLYDYGCYGSRTIYVAGRAVQLAARDICRQLKEAAGIMLGVRPTHIDCQDGFAFDRHHPKKQLSYGEIAVFALNELEHTITSLYEHASVRNPGVGAAHFAEVEVDTYTGLTRVLRYVAVHDVGFAINPEICRAQVGGGVQQGIGIALGELIRVNPKNGQLLKKGLQSYGMLNAWDMPRVETILIEDGEEHGPFGAKSLGEVAVVPVTPCVTAAVNHALGTNLLELPLNPTAIMAALSQKEGV